MGKMNVLFDRVLHTQRKFKMQFSSKKCIGFQKRYFLNEIYQLRLKVGVIH